MYTIDQHSDFLNYEFVYLMRAKLYLIGMTKLYIIRTVRVAYYEHSFIMNQAEGPNKYTPIAFVLNQVRLI